LVAYFWKKLKEKVYAAAPPTTFCWRWARKGPGRLLRKFIGVSCAI